MNALADRAVVTPAGGRQHMRRPIRSVLTTPAFDAMCDAEGGYSGYARQVRRTFDRLQVA